MARKQTTLPAENTAAKQRNDLVEQTPREKRAAMVPKYEGRTLTVTEEQRDAMLDALCTDHTLVLSGAVASASACNPYEGEDADRQRNIALRLLVELAPQNALERLLIQQLVASDMAASVCLGIGTFKENNSDYRRKYMNLACQFMSVQTRQIEALAKLRTGGRQHVTVEHVTVEAGGQAIVGAVTQGTGGGGGNDR